METSNKKRMVVPTGRTGDDLFKIGQFLLHQEFISEEVKQDLGTLLDNIQHNGGETVVVDGYEDYLAEMLLYFRPQFNKLIRSMNQMIPRWYKNLHEGKNAKADTIFSPSNQKNALKTLRVNVFQIKDIVKKY